MRFIKSFLSWNELPVLWPRHTLKRDILRSVTAAQRSGVRIFFFIEVETRFVALPSRLSARPACAVSVPRVTMSTSSLRCSRPLCWLKLEVKFCTLVKTRRAARLVALRLCACCLLWSWGWGAQLLTGLLTSVDQLPLSVQTNVLTED